MVDNLSYFTIRPPRDGAYRLTIYVKDTTPSSDSASKDGVYGGVCEYQLIRESLSSNQVIKHHQIFLYIVCSKVLLLININFNNKHYIITIYKPHIYNPTPSSETPGGTTFPSLCKHILGNG